MSIPKIIHQLWIGPKIPPTKFMDTWKNKHESEGFEYIIWTDEEMKKRGFVSVLQNRIDEMRELAGVADILRWEILYKYGGIYVDADSFCLESITYLVEKYKAFVGYENEQVRGAGWVGNNPEYDDVLARTHPLISNGTMAFPPKHELPRLAIEYIKKTTVDFNKCFKRAWRTTGPGLLTRLYFSKKWDDITILPSYCFLPIHCSGVEYKGHSKIYAHQEWGSTKDTYENINNLTLPEQFNIPSTNVSILIANYNTKAIYIKECLDSIKHQEGNIFIEIVWIDDGSDNINKNIAKKQLDNFINTTRFTSLVYKENDKNYGLGRALHDGVNLCTNEIIFRMDTDDIMIHTRISKQLDFMDNNPDAAICGAQIAMFRNNIKNIVDTTNHPNHTLESYKNKPVHWIMNHPTFCFRKSKIIEAGNYNKKTRNMIDDFELELKLLQKYKIIYNIPEILLLYRLHPEQLTHNGGIDGPKKWKDIRNKLIQDIIYTQ
jgi:mannosyltransferase OCH1-like enzyme